MSVNCNNSVQPGAASATSGDNACVISSPKILADLNSSKSWIRISVKLLGSTNSIRTLGAVPAFDEGLTFEDGPAKALTAMVEASGTNKLRHRLVVFIVKKISTEKHRAHPVSAPMARSAGRKFRRLPGRDTSSPQTTLAKRRCLG